MAKALFLDRDGVINQEKEGSYIFSVAEFVLYEGALEALAALSSQFDYLFVVTHQRGIGRGLMTEDDLQEIHQHLDRELRAAGGRIDGFYFAPAVDRNDAYRKPNIGMGLAAKADFPDIDFDNSVMVGNNLSDMKFGKSLGMKTIFLYTTLPAFTSAHALIDEQFPSLQAFAQSCIGDNK